jgi:phosphorylcholine metabolism protein LicD
MDTSLALEALKKIQKICPSSFILFGTLIGCMRNSSYIPWDRDMDFGILFEDWKEEFRDLFIKEGFVILTDVFWTHPKSVVLVNNEMMGKRSKIQMYYKQKPIRICLEVFSKGNDNCRYSGCGGPWRIFKCPEEYLAKTIKHAFYDTEVNIPERYNDFLTYVYGPDWKIPNKCYIGSKEYKIKEKEWKIILN